MDRVSTGAPTDILDINDSIDIDEEDDGEHIVSKLREKVLKRKGRGFVETRDYEKIATYGSQETVEQGPANSPLKSVEGWILFVTSIHEEASEEDVNEKFSEYGRIKNLSLNLDRRTGFVKGYALIEYGTYDEANSAREALNGSTLLGAAIGVEWCFVNGPKKSDRKKKKH
ncbi:RNA-binding protein 8A-like [Aethina tumida]|uniref:RNA-binding protein 8A-like n=1 Tax=Aethina tumida TaxID=116153 RepID=UPI00096B129B|nr:RNA-binding protein 8A-like [Aethina tumida]